MTDPQVLYIRIAKDLRDAVAAEAERQGVSVNHYVATLLAGAVGWQPKPEGGKK